jgi:hypothetical protein
VSSRPTRDPNAASIEHLIVIPVFDDWDAAALLLPLVDRAMKSAARDAHVLLVDDGSSTPADDLVLPPFEALKAVDVLSLRRNLGHQRALSIGLAYAEQRLDPAVVIVMDGDGEDDPQDIPALLSKLDETRQKKIVFAERKRRSEPVLFRFFYLVYRALHFVLTGYRVRVGNFSVIPRSALARIVVVSESWNHYAAAVFNARIAYTTVPTTRAKRLDGRSKMSFIALVVHGLSALSVYSHIIGVRVLVATFALVTVSAFALMALVIASVIGTFALPSWVLYSVAALLVLLFQFVIAAVLFVFVMLAGRQGSSFIPIRDYVYFVDRLTRVRSRARGAATV